MTGFKSAFAELDTGTRGTVRFGDGSTVGIEGRGTVLFRCKSGEHQALTGVYHIPRLTANIISLRQLEEEGCRILMEKGELRIWDLRRRLVAVVARGASRLYVLTVTIDRPICLLAHGKETAWRWHARYGHLGFQGLQRLSKKEMVRGLPCIQHVDQVCDGCLVGKQRRQPFPAVSRFRAQRHLELVHADLCGPISPATPGGKKTFLLVVDDKSRYMWLTLLSSKDQAGATLIRLQARAEAQVGCKLGTLRTDRGGEFTASSFVEHCAGQGVQRHLTTPYSPQQNGVVERRNQTVLGMARCMLKSMGVPGRFWGEAVTTAVFLLNRAPTRSLEDMTPYEAWYGTKPAVHFFRTFGCVAHVKVTGGHIRKLDDRSTPMVFIGYEPGTKGYRLYNPDTNRVVISRDVVFDEGRAWSWERGSKQEWTDTGGDPFVVEYVVVPGHGSAAATPAPSSSSRAASSARGVSGETSPSAAPDMYTSRLSGTGGTPEPVVPSQVEFVSPPAHDLDLDIDTDEGDALRFRMLSDFYDIDTVPTEEEVEEALFGELLMAVGEGEPSTVEEAKEQECWLKAMKAEMASIEENRTWTLVNLPHGHRAIGLKWVFKVKRDEQGAVVKHKARLVAKGYVQKEGVDFGEVFAPVARMESVRMLLAVAAQEGWFVHHMDVKSAFLNGVLEEEVYVQQPPGFIAAGHEGKVLKLHKALYGLRQAPRAWNVKLDSSLKNLGFKRCASEHGVYTKGEGTSRVIVGVYVDDLIITGADSRRIEQFKQEMKNEFQMSDLGLLSFYLGIEVKQGRKAITLGQSAYAIKVLGKAGMLGCNLCHTPMEVRLQTIH